MRCFWQGGDYTSIEEDSEESCIRQLPRGGVALFCPSQENLANCKAWTRRVRCPPFWVVKAWILQCMKDYLKLFTPYFEEVILNYPVHIHQPFFVQYVWLITFCEKIRRKKIFLHNPNNNIGSFGLWTKEPGRSSDWFPSRKILH